ncbi:MAG TPA: type II toxin-antitoxin system HicB family antitoxin [Actinomycetes bacterium]|jgi:predicted RNase H-like HicB family nuclease|nr:type II toxin-antitoxin system HicB family antitoxin [Actinomycetes bacterium]
MTTKVAHRRTYEVTAERDGSRWFLRVNELPGVFSQVRRLDQADGMARDAIASFLDVAPDGFDVSVTVRLPSDLQRDVAGVIDLRGVIDRTEREYAERTRHLARRLVQGEGLTVREAGRVLGLSYQRVSQLVATAGPA